MVEEDENDDIICLDSDCEPSTQPRIKNQPNRAPLAPMNPNCDLTANCSPIKKRKLLDNENTNPKKSKIVKDILKKDPQPAPVAIKQEIKPVKDFLSSQKLQAQAKSEQAPPPVVTKYDYKERVPAQLQARLDPHSRRYFSGNTKLIKDFTNKIDLVDEKAIKQNRPGFGSYLFIIIGKFISLIF